MPALGFCKLSHRNNDEVVGDFVYLIKLLKFMPIYTF
jgi:hypothetical protein